MVNNNTHKEEMFILSSGINDECIYQWRMVIEDDCIDRDLVVYDVDEDDKFNEIQKISRFNNDKNVLLPLRVELQEVKEQIDHKEQPE